MHIRTCSYTSPEGENLQLYMRVIVMPRQMDRKDNGHLDHHQNFSQWGNYLTTQQVFLNRPPLPHYNSYFNKPDRHNKVMSVFNDNIMDSLKIDVILCSEFFSATSFLGGKL